MDEARFEYRCRRCGVVKCEGATGWKNVDAFLMNAVYEFPLPKGFIGGELSMQSIHHCEDGGLGVSDLIGAERRKTE